MRIDASGLGLLHGYAKHARRKQTDHPFNANHSESNRQNRSHSIEKNIANIEQYQQAEHDNVFKQHLSSMARTALSQYHHFANMDKIDQTIQMFGFSEYA